MASRTRTYKIGPDLDDAATLRAKQLGYPSEAAYIKALIRLDCVCQSGHSVTLPWAQESLPVQDQIDAKVLARTQKGQGITSARLKTLNWQDL